MQRRLLAVACASAVAAGAFASESRWTPRHIKLEAGGHEGAIRFLAGAVSLDGDKPSSWVTVTRAGTFRDPRYGEFEISREMLLAMVDNFKKRVYGQDVMIDVAHKPDNGAAGKVVELALDGVKLRARVEWTPYGVDAIKNRGYQYLSAEYHENWQDNEKGQHHGPMLCGAGLTIRPVVKHLDPVQLSEDYTGAHPTLIAHDFQSKLLEEQKTMFKDLIDALRKRLGTLQLAEAVIAQLVTLAEAAVGKTTDKAVAEALIASLESGAKQLAEAIAASGNKDVKITLAIPDSLKAGMTPDEVKKLMQDLERDRAAAAKTLAETLGSRVLLLSTTIGAAQGLSDELKKELTESVKDLVTAEMTEDQVKRLAANQIAQGNRLVAQLKLIEQGYAIPGATGHVHISVDGSNEIKALQEEVDKRLYSRMPADRRYSLSNGALLAGNKQIVEEALAQFDHANARRLHAEYQQMKKLAAGDSVVSDVAIPVSFERTVLRESLYQLTGLPLCDVGTAQFAAVVQLPYSYRDTAAAGAANARVYEGGAVARAAVKQALEEARPLPQKLSFEVSDELRYLVGNGQINFDIVAENASNAVRIVGEDSEQLIYNEHLRAADEYAKVDVVAENLELQADGAKKVFILAGFPVVRPRVIKDLQGNVVATQNPVTVTYNAVALAEYTGGQAAGTYYVLNYNLGEIYLVNEAGAIQTPADATAYTISYSYTTNVHKWDMDLGALTVEKKWNDFLYRFGTRRTALEDRSHMATLATMSGVVRDLIGQAEQFGANFKREGTDLDATGNVGRIKDVPTWRAFAPGLYAGDQRVVIGERRVVRYRMLKAWSMGMLQDQKNADGRFTGKKEAYGDQFIVVHTPTQLKAALTSMVIYSAAARVARAAP